MGSEMAELRKRRQVHRIVRMRNWLNVFDPGVDWRSYEMLVARPAVEGADLVPEAGQQGTRARRARGRGRCLAKGTMVGPSGADAGAGCVAARCCAGLGRKEEEPC